MLNQSMMLLPLVVNYRLSLQTSIFADDLLYGDSIKKQLENDHRRMMACVER